MVRRAWKWLCGLTDRKKRGNTDIVPWLLGCYMLQEKVHRRTMKWNTYNPDLTHILEHFFRMLTNGATFYIHYLILLSQYELASFCLCHVHTNMCGLCVNISRWPCLSGRLYLNNLMRQGSNNHQTKQPEWEVTAKENMKQGKCFHTHVWVLSWVHSEYKKKVLVFSTCHVRDKFVWMTIVATCYQYACTKGTEIIL